MWIVLALGTALLTSLTPIIVKRLLVAAEVPVVIWTAQLIALPLLATFALTIFGLSTVDHLFIVLVAIVALLNAAAHITATSALTHSDASLIAPLLTLSPVVTLGIGAVVLGEQPSRLGTLGVLTIVGGAYALQFARGQAWYAPLRALWRERGARLALLAASIWGVTPLLEKLAITHTAPINPPLVPLASTIGVTLMLFPVVVRRPQRLMIQARRAGRGLLLVGLISGTAPLLGFTALRLGIAGYVTALFTLRIVFITLWSVLLLGERPSRWRWCGVGLLALGALLIAQ
jgi:drug/metabolite transporter (DMT)-like permease